MSGPVESLSAAQARRVALAAQGFKDPPHAVPTMRTLLRALRRTAVLQIDSVNVLQRAHYMPVWSRTGAYDVDLIRRAAEERPRRLVEYWAHVAAFMPVDLWPVMRHRMRRYREEGHAWTGLPENRELAASLLAEIAERGAATARFLDDGLPRSRTDWGWNWSATKQTLEYLFLAGEVAVAGRTQQFERLYDLPERVVPREHLEAPEPTVEEAARELVRRAARSHGVATAASLRDYFRMPAEQVAPAVASLVEDGELVPVRVEGWGRPAYLHRDATVPRRVDACTLLSPFDPVVWERDRTEQLFGFRYRIEIYVPRPKRVHGYYVLPFLLGERLVARVDLKADRARGVLVVKAAHAEEDAPPETAERLGGVLEELGDWLGLDAVEVEERGDLSGALSSVVSPARPVPQVG